MRYLYKVVYYTVDVAWQLNLSFNSKRNTVCPLLLKSAALTVFVDVPYHSYNIKLCRFVETTEMNLRAEGRSVSLDEPSIEHCTSTQHSSYHLPSRIALDGVVTRPLTLSTVHPMVRRLCNKLAYPHTQLNRISNGIASYLLIVCISNQVH